MANQQVSYTHQIVDGQRVLKLSWYRPNQRQAETIYSMGTAGGIVNGLPELEAIIGGLRRQYPTTDFNWAFFMPELIAIRIGLQLSPSDFVASENFIRVTSQNAMDFQWRGNPVRGVVCLTCIMQFGTNDAGAQNVAPPTGRRARLHVPQEPLHADPRVQVVRHVAGPGRGARSVELFAFHGAIVGSRAHMQTLLDQLSTRAASFNITALSDMYDHLMLPRDHGVVPWTNRENRVAADSFRMEEMHEEDLDPTNDAEELNDMVTALLNPDADDDGDDDDEDMD